MAVAGGAFDPGFVRFSSMDVNDVGRTVQFVGLVESVHTASGTTFMELSNGSARIDAVAFRPLDVDSGDTISGVGTVEMYEGSLELIVREVRERR